MSSLRVEITQEQMNELLSVIDESGIEKEVIEETDHIGGIIFSILFWGTVIIAVAIL